VIDAHNLSTTAVAEMCLISPVRRERYE